MELHIAVPEEHVNEDVLEPALETLTRLNTRLIQDGTIPPFEQALKAGRVKWKPEPPGAERFDHGGIVMVRGWGDCDDLAPWKAASLRASGQDPGAQAGIYRSGPNRWHAVVKTSDDKILDPSKDAGMGKVEGIAPAVVAPMFHGPSVVGGEARPAIAFRRIITPSGNVGYQSRVDLPMGDTDYAISTNHRRRSARESIVGAILGACLVGESAEVCAPAHLKRLYAVAGILDGDDPAELVRVLGRAAVVGALPFVETAASELGSESLDGFNFGKFLKILTPIVSTAVQFVPGVGPIVSKGLDFASNIATKAIDAGQAIKSAANALSSFPEQGGLSIQFQVYDNAMIAPAGH